MSNNNSDKTEREQIRLSVPNVEVQFQTDPAWIHFVNANLSVTKTQIILNPTPPYSIQVIPVTALDKIGKKSKSRKLHLYLKDFRSYIISFKKALIDFEKVYLLLLDYVKFTDPALLAPCLLRLPLDVPDPGWTFFSQRKEYERLGITQANSKWRITECNVNFEVCSTYPEYLVVPKDFPDTQLLTAAKFRSKERFPVLTWRDYRPANFQRYRQREPRVGEGSILRSAMPLVGVSGARNSSDEALLKAVINTNSDINTLQIIDCRPKMVGVASIAAGGGYEFGAGYEHCHLTFMGVENIHIMRDSFESLFDLLQETIPLNMWYTKLEATAWLKHIRTILAAAVRVIEIIDVERGSCLIHCTDGWDRSAQVCSLAELCLDPYYRTLEGFQALIEKDWLWMGHRFQDRTHGNERGPIFLQFLDCVHQITNQFPSAFEFNQKLLIFLLDSLQSCRFGTFMYDCHRERKENELHKKTPSIWSYVAQHKREFVNPIYFPKNETLVPNCSEKIINIWAEYYLRWDSTLSVNNQTLDQQKITQRFESVATKLAELKPHLKVSQQSELVEEIFREIPALKMFATQELSSTDAMQSFVRKKPAVSKTKSTSNFTLDVDQSNQTATVLHERNPQVLSAPSSPRNFDGTQTVRSPFHKATPSYQTLRPQKGGPFLNPTLSNHRKKNIFLDTTVTTYRPREPPAPSISEGDGIREEIRNIFGWSFDETPIDTNANTNKNTNAMIDITTQSRERSTVTEPPKLLIESSETTEYRQCQRLEVNQSIENREVNERLTQKLMQVEIVGPKGQKVKLAEENRLGDKEADTSSDEESFEEEKQKRRRKVQIRNGPTNITSKGTLRRHNRFENTLARVPKESPVNQDKEITYSTYRRATQFNKEVQEMTSTLISAYKKSSSATDELSNNTARNFGFPFATIAKDTFQNNTLAGYDDSKKMNNTFQSTKSEEVTESPPTKSLSPNSTSAPSSKFSEKLTPNAMTQTPLPPLIPTSKPMPTPKSTQIPTSAPPSMSELPRLPTLIPTSGTKSSPKITTTEKLVPNTSSIVPNIATVPKHQQVSTSDIRTVNTTKDQKLNSSKSSNKTDVRSQKSKQNIDSKQHNPKDGNILDANINNTNTTVIKSETTHNQEIATSNKTTPKKTVSFRDTKVLSKANGTTNDNILRESPSGPLSATVNSALSPAITNREPMAIPSAKAKTSFTPETAKSMPSTSGDLSPSLSSERTAKDSSLLSTLLSTKKPSQILAEQRKRAYQTVKQSKSPSNSQKIAHVFSDLITSPSSLPPSKNDTLHQEPHYQSKDARRYCAKCRNLLNDKPIRCNNCFLLYCENCAKHWKPRHNTIRAKIPPQKMDKICDACNSNSSWQTSEFMVTSE